MPTNTIAVEFAYHGVLSPASTPDEALPSPLLEALSAIQTEDKPSWHDVTPTNVDLRNEENAKAVISQVRKLLSGRRVMCRVVNGRLVLRKWTGGPRNGTATKAA